MQRASLLLSLATILAWSLPAPAQSPAIFPSGAEPPAPAINLETYLSPNTPRTFDFIGESLQNALRKLARAARMNIVVADGVEGVVNMRFEDKTPRDAMMIILESKDLVFKEGKNGVYFIRSKNPPLRISATDKKDAGQPASTNNTLPTPEEINTFLPALTSFADALLDYQVRPEVARKRARAKKALYDAFVAQGFTTAEALRLVLTNRDVSDLGSD